MVNTWTAFALKITLSTSAGYQEIRIDGTTIPGLTLAGANTGSGQIAYVQLVGGALYNEWNFDNLWIFNTLGTHSNDFPTGRIVVTAQRPVSDGTYLDWTPDSGIVRYSRVSETVADDDLSYVDSAVPGARETFGIGSLPGGISQIHGVQITAIHRKDDLNPKVMHILGKSGSTLAESPDIDVPLGYTSSTLLLADDPNTSAQWTAAAADALEIGVKEIS